MPVVALNEKLQYLKVNQLVVESYLIGNLDVYVLYGHFSSSMFIKSNNTSISQSPDNLGALETLNLTGWSVESNLLD